MNIVAISPGAQISLNNVSIGNDNTLFEDQMSSILKRESISNSNDSEIDDYSDFIGLAASIISDCFMNNGLSLNEQEAIQISNELLNHEGFSQLLSQKMAGVLEFDDLNKLQLKADDEQQEINAQIPEFNETVIKIMDEIVAGLGRDSNENCQKTLDAFAMIAGQMRMQESHDDTNIENNLQMEVADVKQEEIEIVNTTTFKQTKTIENKQETKQNVFGDINQEVKTIELVVEKPIEAASFTTKIIDTIKTNINSNNIYIRLKPDDLGSIAIKLTMTKDGVIAKMVTDNQQTKELLASQVNNFTNSLKEKGINVLNMEVIYNSLSEQSGDNHNSKQQSENKNKNSKIAIENDQTNFFELMDEEEIQDSNVYKA